MTAIVNGGNNHFPFELNVREIIRFIKIKIHLIYVLGKGWYMENTVNSKVCYFSLFSIKRIMKGHNKACVLRKELHVVNYFKIYEYFLFIFIRP